MGGRRPRGYEPKYPWESVLVSGDHRIDLLPSVRAPVLSALDAHPAELVIFPLEWVRDLGLAGADRLGAWAVAARGALSGEGTDGWLNPPGEVLADQEPALSHPSAGALVFLCSAHLKNKSTWRLKLPAQISGQGWLPAPGARVVTAPDEGALGIWRPDVWSAYLLTET
jgi:hypothetical protein